MDIEASQLRNHADHCRKLARGPCDYRMRTMLLTMASEFEGQADAAEAAEARGHG